MIIFTASAARSPHALATLKRTQSELAGQTVDLRRQLDKLQADIFHVDMVLRPYIPTKGRMPARSAFFRRNEITRRCCNRLREKATITADEVTVRAMREKGLDPETDRNLRTDFAHSRVAAQSTASRHGGEDRRRARSEMEAGRHLAGHH